MFSNTLGPMFIFKEMDINHQSCPPSYKLSNDPNKTMGLHFTIHIRKICWLNFVLMYYATSNGFMNGDNGIFKALTTYCEKPSIWIMFQKSKIGTLTKIYIYSHYYNKNTKSKWTITEPIIKDIRVGDSKLFIIIQIQFPIQLAIAKTIHCC